MIQFDRTEFESMVRGIIREELAGLTKKQEEKFYTIKETALKLRVSQSTVHKWKQSGKISFFKDGAIVLISSSEIERMLNNFKTK